MGGAAVTLLEEARAAGLEIRLEAGRLVVSGPRYREDLAQRLLARKHEMVAALAAEDEAVAWRLAILRTRAPRRGPIPFLEVRNTTAKAGACLSCGEELGEGRSVRCGPCATATVLAIHEVREGVVAIGRDDPADA